MAGVEDEAQVTALREALRQQMLAVTQLKAELEEERQAAASGADEALAMIVRLQAEKAEERMEAEQFRRVAEERMQHDAESLAFLQAVVFHQEMDISSLKRRLMAVCSSNDPYAPAPSRDTSVDMLRRLVNNSVPPRRNPSLPVARLEELVLDLDAGGGDGEEGNSCKNAGDNKRQVRTMSDIGEVIRGEKEWARSNVSLHQSPPRLHRSSSNHRLPPASSYSAQYGRLGNVHDKFETPESVSAHAPLRSNRRISFPPEIIAEEEEDLPISSTERRDGSNKPRKDHTTIAELGADIQQIKGSLKNLEAELIRLREANISRCDAEAQLLAEICTKLDVMHEQQQNVHVHKRSNQLQIRTIREEGSSSKGRSGRPPVELPMNDLIEAMMYIA